MAIDEELIKRNRCPIFNGFTICASGFSPTIKNKIKNLVIQNGGVYQGDLVFGQTTHLVINEPKGDKYRFAKSWKMSIVSLKWIYDSIEAKYCLPEKKYEFDANNSNLFNYSVSKRPRLEKPCAPDSKIKINHNLVKKMTTPMALESSIKDQFKIKESLENKVKEDGPEQFAVSALNQFNKLKREHEKSLRELKKTKKENEKLKSIVKSFQNIVKNLNV